jgi:hypothetical protein
LATDRSSAPLATWPINHSAGESAIRFPFDSSARMADGDLRSQKMSHLSNHWQVERLVWVMRQQSATVEPGRPVQLRFINFGAPNETFAIDCYPVVLMPAWATPAPGGKWSRHQMRQQLTHML